MLTATVKKEGGKETLVISVPLSEPRASKSGTTMLVASETVKGAAQYQGKDLTINLNAYFKP